MFEYGKEMGGHAKDGSAALLHKALDGLEYFCTKGAGMATHAADGFIAGFGDGRNSKGKGGGGGGDAPASGA